MQEEQAENLFKIGQNHKIKWEFAKAISYYSKALKIEKRVKFLTERAECYKELSKKDLALSDILEAIDLDPSNSELFHEKALLTFNLEDFNKAIELDSTNIRAYNNRGQSGGKSFVKDFETAIKLCEEKLNIDPTDSNAFYLRGWAKEKLGNKFEAMDDYSSSIEMDPFHNTALFCRSELKYKMGDKVGAIMDLDSIIKNNAWNAKAYLDRSGINQKLGNHELVIRDLEKALEILPFSFFNHLRLGITKSEAGNIDSAINIFTQLIQQSKEGEGLEAYEHRAIAYLKLENFSSAIEDASYIIESEEKKIQAKSGSDEIDLYFLALNYSLRGEIYMKSGNLKAALVDFSKKLRLLKLPDAKEEILDRVRIHIIGELVDGFFKRSAVKTFLGDKKGAEEDIEKYFEYKNKLKK